MHIFLATALNSEPVKYAIVALAAPMWIPFIKALWHTLNDGLREEGGLLGRPPTQEQLLDLERRYGPAAASLISVAKDGGLRPGEPRGGRGSPRAPSGGGQGALRKRGGFR